MRGAAPLALPERERAAEPALLRCRLPGRLPPPSFVLLPRCRGAPPRDPPVPPSVWLDAPPRCALARESPVDANDAELPSALLPPALELAGGTIGSLSAAAAARSASS